VESNGYEDAFWMEETQIEGNSTNNVTDFIAHITPHFSAILQHFNINTKQYFEKFIDQIDFPWVVFDSYLQATPC
jgi:hypothetical protein